MERFVVVSLEDAFERGWINEDMRDADYRCGLFEQLENGSVRLLGTDGGEPEDQTLGRDWKWVVKDLNALASAGTIPASMPQHGT